MTRLMMAMTVLCACTTGPGTEEKTSPACLEATNHADLAWLQTNVFTPSCTTTGCHTGTAVSAGKLVLTAGATYTNLVGPSASGVDGWKRVVPGDPASSYLLVALGHEPGPMPRDGYMPLRQPALCQQKIDALQRWIEAGAPP